MASTTRNIIVTVILVATAYAGFALIMHGLGLDSSDNAPRHSPTAQFYDDFDSRVSQPMTYEERIAFDAITQSHVDNEIASHSSDYRNSK